MLVIALLLLGAMSAAAAIGRFMQRYRSVPSDGDADASEGYVVSAVLGLLALLLGFTFSLAVDRFDARRLLVLQEANAIGTAYLRSQLLGEPDRTRMSKLLIACTDNRLLLAKARPGSDAQAALSTKSDALVTDIWAGTCAAFDRVKGLDFSSAYLASINNLIDLDSSRRVARSARVPAEVFAVLLIYFVTAAGVLGYMLKRGRGRQAAGFLLALQTLSLILIVDLNRPVLGGIAESQRPMEELRESLKAQPPAVFDKWRARYGAAPGEANLRDRSP